MSDAPRAARLGLLALTFFRESHHSESQGNQEVFGEMKTMNHEAKLEPEEQELVDSYERDEWRSVPTFQENLRQYQSYAVATFEAIGLISITLPQEDLNAIREKAAARGMSYQALIATIVHQYVTGDLVEKKPHSV
jgi:predicted DNA binding CopG/RHH family protein